MVWQRQGRRKAVSLSPSPRPCHDPPVRAVPSHILLRADAVAYALVGILLLLAPNHDLFDALGLPQPSPELFTQLAGALLVTFAVLLWEAPSDATLEHHVGRAAAIANTLGAVIFLRWLLVGDLETTALGATLLWVVSLGSALFALLESRYLRPS